MGPIRDFGINAAIGVIIAYITVIFFFTTVPSSPGFKVDQIIKLGAGGILWEKSRWNGRTGLPRLSPAYCPGGVATLLISLWGISRITTNYSISNNLPIGKR